MLRLFVLKNAKTGETFNRYFCEMNSAKRARDVENKVLEEPFIVVSYGPDHKKFKATGLTALS